MQNTVAKKRARWGDVDSDYLFANFLQLPGFRSTPRPRFFSQSVRSSQSTLRATRKRVAGIVNISGPLDASFLFSSLFMVFLQIIQAASNSLVSAIGVTSFGSTRIDKSPEALSSRFPEKLIESRRARSRLVRNSTAAPSKV